jgi:hypothetical protein
MLEINNLGLDPDSLKNPTFCCCLSSYPLIYICYDFIYSLTDEMILATPEANSPVIEDHPLNPNPASNWQNFFKVSHLRYGT